ncbi:ABC transporter substrate-binding protein [Conexibacter sp. CPCC 206217]|uniref:ABC transporter substrate-binding protein n=1 Tax=Conexibacter sp. CPCC 206217 TaxID=3064574 RepID=UPI002716B1BC|nr:ABC transporter substrate-binding protein [Conexibacter sp. CPCC 206217]MDO8210174.1 ABC transporter substrate-binding protein [Conexibacter sp. CPCC 206217]
MTGRADHNMGDRTLTRRSAIGLAAGIAGAGLLAGCGGASGGADTGATTATAGTGRGGGTLRLGALGGGSAETLNPWVGNSACDYARAYQVYEPLVRFEGTDLTNVLLDSYEANADASEWTLRLVDATWHNGRPLTADDVIYSMRYAVETKAYSSDAYKNIDLRGLKKLDARTVKVPLRSPNFLFLGTLATVYGAIIQDGFTDFDKPIGTGPFEFVSWAQGERAAYKRFGDYRLSGQPLLEGIEILSLNDPQARINALISGQVDAIATVPAANASSLASTKNIKLIDTPSGSAASVAMRTNQAPFDDVRVRQALRLLVDREQLVSAAFSGKARVGNDLFSWFDPDYASQLPQRAYDPEQARSLLRQAGQSDLQVELLLADQFPGHVELGELYGPSAAKGGVKVKINKVTPAAFGDQYTKAPFFVGYWTARRLGPQWDATLVSGAVFDETDWDNPRWASAYAAARRTRDEAKRKQHMLDAQSILYEEGGYIIPYFPNFIDATASKVSGTRTSIQHSFGMFDFRGTSVA